MSTCYGLHLDFWPSQVRRPHSGSLCCPTYTFPPYRCLPCPSSYSSCTPTKSNQKRIEIKLKRIKLKFISFFFRQQRQQRTTTDNGRWLQERLILIFFFFCVLKILYDFTTLLKILTDHWQESHSFVQPNKNVFRFFNFNFFFCAQNFPFSFAFTSLLSHTRKSVYKMKKIKSNKLQHCKSCQMQQQHESN